MNVALPKPWTAERFLHWAERQERKFEFDGSAPIEMSPVTFGHSTITQNIFAVLRARAEFYEDVTFPDD